MSLSETITFIGASTGVGLAALKHSLAAGHQCIALCRTPSKLTDIFPPTKTPSLRVVQGNAHDAAAVAKCLQKSDGTFVDVVFSTIGAKPVITKLVVLSMDDAEVCQKGMAALLNAIAEIRGSGVSGRPHLIACSTTGMSRFGRDISIAMIPVYNVLSSTLELTRALWKTV